MTWHKCDICETDAPRVIPEAAEYGLEGRIVVCGSCGFVYVPERRSELEIADSWSNEIFGNGYSSTVPYVQARLYYVALELADHLDLTGATVMDVGAGEGLLLRYIRDTGVVSREIGIDPGEANAVALRSAGFEAFQGTAQAAAKVPELVGAADVVTMTWTIENSNDCNEIIESCRTLLKPDGALVIATGSRVLVPFKKPLGDYFSPDRNPDTHSFRWSRRSLANLLGKHGFSIKYENHWHDSDWMVLIARRADTTSTAWTADQADCDNPDDILQFFKDWHAHSEWLNSRWAVSART
jgi:2-polyprenyl-3-methyl-5-hydroxy-6-metoxy-1,4-benzoquinol methylase